jgi:hypothetical protein
MSLNILKNLIKEGIEDFVSQQQRETISFEDNPLEYILQKYPSLDATLVDLMTENYRDYTTGVFVIAPKPTTFRILLHNGQEFYLIYGPNAYTAKISGKKYYLLNLSEEQFAINAIASLLELGMPPGSEGPGEQMDNEADIKGGEDLPAEDTPAEEPAPEEELAETEEVKPKTPLRFKIIKESLSKKSHLNEVKKDFNSLSPKAKEVGNNIINQLNIPQEDLLSSSSNRIIILSDLPRPKMFKQLEDLGYIRDPSIPGSGMGGFKNEDGVQIIVKPKSGQGAKSSGKENESSFFNLINNKIQENGSPITVIFKSDNKNIINKNVSKCVDSSVEGATDFAKADAQLLDPSNKVISNISLKKRNAVRWESSKSRLIGGINIFKSFIEKASQNVFKDIALEPIKGVNKKFKLFNPQTNKILSKVIIKDTPEDVVKDVVFGNDNPSTIVIKEDFENFSNYTFENEVLVINCYKIYDSVDDILGTDDEPVFAFSNHIGQAYGIEFRSFSKGLLYKDNELKGSSAEISFNELK